MDVDQVACFAVIESDIHSEVIKCLLGGDEDVVVIRVEFCIDGGEFLRGYFFEIAEVA